MCYDPYVLPVKRLGNEENPRLVILLCNPGGDPQWSRRLPEYAMRADRVYKDSKMPLDLLQEYNPWWDDFIAVFQKYHIKTSEVLLLEYYPYHSGSSDDFVHNPKHWDGYARKALDENIKILRQQMAQSIPIFGYYYSDWLRAIPELKEYQQFNKTDKRWKKLKIKELDRFLKGYYK